jgi:hypothetical protein
MKGGNLLVYTVVVCLCGVGALRAQQTGSAPGASQMGADLAGSASVVESVVPLPARVDHIQDKGRG